jgi:outer membrane protein insertion porin family
VLKFKHTYILLILATLIVACKQTKYVPEGRYLLKKNKIEQSGKKIPKDDLAEIVRQQPNYKRFGVKWKLIAFNLVDSTKVANKRVRKNEKIFHKNREKLKKQDRINSARVDKAVKKGKSHYTEKLIPLKDTLNPRKFFREWYKYKIGSAPVVFDSILFNKSIEQLNLFLKKKGFYYGNVSGSVEYKDNKKCIPTYVIETGPQYEIDSVYVIEDNDLVRKNYESYLEDNESNSINNQPFDSDVLDNHRYRVAKYMRNQGLYGFSTSNITFIADTNQTTMKAIIGVSFGDRLLISKVKKDSVLHIKHEEAFMHNVYFHLADTLREAHTFSKRINNLGLQPFEGQFLRTLDTIYFTRFRDKNTGEIDVSRMAIFTYNGRLAIKPRVLEMQNYLEIDSRFSEKNLEKTYLSLLQLNLFEVVKTDIKETETACLDAHYYLIPSKKQSFSFEPKATNSNGFLGVAATINYTNKNLFRGAEKLTLSFSGGFESQPAIFDETIDGDKIQTAGRSFNTFEIGPSASLEIPGIFPLRMSNFSKKLRPKTVISSNYNFQRRDDFTRGTLQLSYIWKFFASKTMIFQSGIPGASVIKYVNISKSPEFESKLVSLNDLFLLNSYSNQFIWQDWKFTFEYNIREKENRKGNAQVYFKSSFDPAGNIFALFKKYQDTLDNGQKAIFGIGYSQFARIDNELILAKPLRKEKSLNFKVDIGGGLPYGNTATSLPYDYSFFGGGANDIRGWRARALGPGSYKYYLDLNRTATQIGDIGLSASAEFRFPISSLVKSAIFVDAGNIWTIFEDVNRPGGQISTNWFKEIAVAAGVGLRLDLDFFIVRVDLGIPIMNPALPQGAQWIWQSRQPYYDEGIAVFGDPYYKEVMPLPFIPQLHFGIGYPF